MIEYASPQCQTSCDIIGGPVNDVQPGEITGRGGEVIEIVTLVQLNRDHDTATSEPLQDLGTTEGYDNNQHYLTAVQSCAGAVACGPLRRRRCGAMVGDHPLRDYKIK